MEKKLDKETDRYFNRGLTALDDGNWLMAVQCFRKCIELDPKFTPARHELADIYYANGQYDAAVGELTAALVADPNDLEASFALGNTYAAQGKHKEALRVFKRIENEAPDFAPELFYNIGMSYKALAYPELALEYLNLALEEDPSYFECLEVIGRLHLDANRLAEAKKAFEEVIEYDPANINAHHTLGVIHSKEQHWDLAIEEWEKVLSLAPNTDEALRELGWALNMVGEYEKAVTALKKAIEMNPHNLQARIDLGAVFMSNLKFDDAVDEWEKVRREDPANPVIKKFLSDADALRKSKEGKGKD